MANDVYEDFTFPKRATTYSMIRDYLKNHEDRDKNMFKGHKELLISAVMWDNILRILRILM